MSNELTVAITILVVLIVLASMIITRLARIERSQRILLSKLSNERPPEDFGGI